MNSRYRSVTGAAIAVLALPVFLGLLACIPTFPVPVGDPEKSSIDPAVSGIWRMEDEDVFYVFEPYDKRTWAVTAFELTENLEGCEYEETDDESLDDEYLELSDFQNLMVDIEKYGTHCYEVGRAPGLIKAWRTKLGGEWFMTWQPMGIFDAETGFTPPEWMVFRLDTSQPNRLRLIWIDLENEAWKEMNDGPEEDVTRRAVERIIRKHADEEDFYEEDAILIFDRVLPEHYELFEDFLDEGPLS